MGFSPLLLLLWGLRDLAWCCIPAVPVFILFLFAELQALAAASKAWEQPARMVEGLGKHAWYFPSFPPPPSPDSSPALRYFQPGICGLSVCMKGCTTVCFCHLFLLEVGRSGRIPLHLQRLVLTAGLLSVVCPLPAAPLGMAFTGGSQSPFPHFMPYKPHAMP